VQNNAGLFGAYAAGFLNDVFGVASLIWPLMFGTLGAAYVAPSLTMRWLRWCGFFLLTLCLLVLVSTFEFSLGALSGGGMLGDALSRKGAFYLSPTGSFLLWIFCFLVGTQLAFGLSWISLVNRIATGLVQGGRAVKNRVPKDASQDPDSAATNRRSRLPRPEVPYTVRLVGEKFLEWFGGVKKAEEPIPDMVVDIDDEDDPLPKFEDISPEDGKPTPPAQEPAREPKGETPDEPADGQKKTGANGKDKNGAPKSGKPSDTPPPKGKLPPYPLPPLDLLQPPPASKRVPKEDLDARGKALIETLKTYNVECELTRITPGPVITMYEIRPAPGVRVNRISNLSPDLARALKALAIRIQAPIPGSDTVGIEIPNTNRETVSFRELAATEAFRTAPGALTFILGKDIAGRPSFEDLARMPHMLVAGSTGAGKSVCLNGIIVSLLYRNQPDRVKLLLVDPKRIEFTAYADEPHLVHPVVTDAAVAKTALQWAVHEMEERYKALERLGVREMSAYNAKLATYTKGLPPELEDLAPLPYIVIIIDELADLMMLAGKEVEASVMRLAQLARAAGIHMILATQRPSVDVITGTIKTNFPCRISFQVASKHDSRTILDQIGAEYLLGNGDMLFKNSGGRLLRLQGPYLSEEEVERVVGHWKDQTTPSYMVSFPDWNPESEEGGDDGGGSRAPEDPLYDEVKEFVMDQGQTSISKIQRRFQIGFNRAARIMEQLQRDGIIGPADGSKPRQVVK
jgi:S-DNA-T family DNA segregation ATPase FtsK/SpoIIIE